jgi:tetratricopeptide (TPR) repeat protein
MEAFGVQGIPHAFIVDRSGHIVWHDHPMSPSFEKTLMQVVEGKFSIEDAKQQVANTKKIEETGNAYVMAAMEAKTSSDELEKLGKKFVQAAEKQPEAFVMFAQFLLSEQADQMLQHRDEGFIEKLGTLAVKHLKEDAGAHATYAMALHENGKKDKAVEHLNKAIKLASSDDEKQYYQEMLKGWESAA